MYTKKGDKNTNKKFSIKKREQSTPGYLNYHTMDNHTFCKEKALNNSKQKTATKNGEKALRLLTVPSMHTHITR